MRSSLLVLFLLFFVFIHRDKRESINAYESSGQRFQIIKIASGNNYSVNDQFFRLIWINDSDCQLIGQYGL